MILQIYGGSTSLPRKIAGIGFNDTYHSLLAEKKSKISAVVNMSIGGCTVVETWDTITRTVNYYDDSIVILAIGLVDSAPRPIPFTVRKIISMLHLRIRNIIINAIHKNRNSLLKIKSWHTTPYKKFVKKYNDILNYLLDNESVRGIIVLNIPPPHSKVVEQSFKSAEYAIQYNEAIKKLVLSKNNEKISLIDIHTQFTNLIKSKDFAESDLLLEDWHHSKCAHALIAELMDSEIMKALP